MKKFIVAFDIDGTLIQGENPNRDVIALYLAFHALGADVKIWSGGGLEYALGIKNKLNLPGEAIEKASIEPDLAIDDNPVDGMAKVIFQV